MMFYKYFLALLLLMSSSFANATDDHYHDLFRSANEAYKAGAYDSAKSLYSQIAENGMVSDLLFYNLGNCHFKMGNIPASILNYERALKLNPSDEDIKYNLAIANTRIVDKIEAIETWFIPKWWKALATSIGPDAWGVWTIVFILFSVLTLGIFVLGKIAQIKKFGLLTALGFVVLFILSFSLGQQSLAIKNEKAGIIFAPSIDVKSEPSLQGVDQFVLHEGTKVEIIGMDGDWFRVKLIDGNSGWIQTRSIELI